MEEYIGDGKPQTPPDGKSGPCSEASHHFKYYDVVFELKELVEGKNKVENLGEAK